MFSPELKELRAGNLHRTVIDRASKQGAHIFLEGREFLNFASNDYLSLAGHPDVVRAAATAMNEFGFGGGASRLLAGGSSLHRMLEEKIAGLKGTEAALIFNSGYAANTGTISALAEEGDVIFSDELNHASIVDGCRLSKAKTIIYRHRDAEHLSYLMEKENGRRKVVLTDTVFSMDGDIAPLRDIYNICLAQNSKPDSQHSTLLYLDDAHGTGVLGSGRGALAHFGICPEPWIIQMGTLSKALGSFGAFIAGSRNIIEWLTNSARSFMFSTAVPACSVAAALRAIELIETTPKLVLQLWKNRNQTVGMLKMKGYDTGGSGTPVIPLRVDSVEEALRLSRHLYEKGIYAPAIRPPTVKTPRVRITVTAEHSEEDIAMLADALPSVKI